MGRGIGPGESPQPHARRATRRQPVPEGGPDPSRSGAPGRLHHRLRGGPDGAAGGADPGGHLPAGGGRAHGRAVGGEAASSGFGWWWCRGRASAGFHESLLRNAPFALVAVFGSVPPLWPVLLVAGVPIVAFESYMIFTDRLGIRDRRHLRGHPGRGREGAGQGGGDPAADPGHPGPAELVRQRPRGLSAPPHAHRSHAQPPALRRGGRGGVRHPGDGGRPGGRHRAAGPPGGAHRGLRARPRARWRGWRPSAPT